MSFVCSRSLHLGSSRRASGALLAIVLGAVTTSVWTSGVASAASGSVAVLLSAPGVQGPALSGTTIETFDDLSDNQVLSSPTTLATGSITGGSLKVIAAGSGGASTTSTTPVPYGSGGATRFGRVLANGTVTISLGAARNYVGFYWTAGDSGSTATFMSEGREVLKLSTADLTNMIPRYGSPVAVNGGGTYTPGEYYGGRESAAPSGSAEPYAYVNIVASGGATIDAVKLAQGGSGGFELDNFTSGDYTGTFDLTGLVGIPADVLADDTYEVAAGDSLTGDVSDNDTLVGSSTFSMVTNTTSGSVIMGSNGTFSYSGATPGTYTFVYKACRSSGTCVTAIGTITVTAASTTTTVAGATTTTVAPSTTAGVGSPTTTVVQGDSDAGEGSDKELGSFGRAVWIMSMLAIVMVIAGLSMARERAVEH